MTYCEQCGLQKGRKTSMVLNALDSFAAGTLDRYNIVGLHTDAANNRKRRAKNDEKNERIKNNLKQKKLKKELMTTKKEIDTIVKKLKVIYSSKADINTEYTAKSIIDAGESLKQPYKNYLKLLKEYRKYI